MKKTVYITGMYCISCETILENEISKIKGFKINSISHKTGKLEIEYDDEKTYLEFEKILNKKNYKINSGEKINKKNKNFLQYFLITIFLLIILGVYSRLDLNKFLPNSENINFLQAFLVGVIASLSSCLAVTGGIIIGFSKSIDSKLGFKKILRTQLSFQFGRILGFMILGGILGIIGTIFKISFGLNILFSLFVGGLIIYLGLQGLGIVPNLSKIGLHLPKGLSKKIHGITDSKYAFFIGIFTFFLPCGFTQTIQLLAINSQSFVSGALIMLFFALGTLPVLLFVGLTTSAFSGKKYEVINKIISILLIIFGIFTISNTSKLLGVYFTKNNSQNIQTEINDYEIKKISHNGWQTVPQEIILDSTKNYKLIINPISNGLGCMSTMIIPGIDSKINYIKKGVKIEYILVNVKPGTYNIVCSSMGMLQGKIIFK